MKVEIDKSIRTFRFPSSELIYFGQMSKLKHLFDKDIMVYCSYGDSIYIPISIQLMKNYGRFRKDILEVHMTAVNMYITMLSKLYNENNLYILDLESGKYIENELLIENKQKNKSEKNNKYRFLDLFTYK